MTIKGSKWLKFVAAAAIGTSMSFSQSIKAQGIWTNSNDEEAEIAAEGEENTQADMEENRLVFEKQPNFELNIIHGFDREWPVLIDEEMVGPVNPALDDPDPREEKYWAKYNGEQVEKIRKLPAKKRPASNLKKEQTAKKVVPNQSNPRKPQAEETVEPTDESTVKCDSMSVHVFKRPRGIGIGYEFGVLELNGKIRNVFAISSGQSGHGTISGTYTLSVLKVNGLPSPWKRSNTYGNSPMFWGLNINGGFWIHSTPHYGQLGEPASMGCVRTSHPTSMEIWDQAVNECGGKTVKINIYKEGTQAALDAFNKLKALPLDPYAEKKLKQAAADNQKLEKPALPGNEQFAMLIERDLADAHAVTTGDYDGNGHRRVHTDRIFKRFKWTKGQTEEPYYPKCGEKDCYEAFNVKHNSSYPTAWQSK